MATDTSDHFDGINQCDKIDELSMQTNMTDVGKYSLVQLCVSLLCKTNETPSDITWSKNYVTKIIEDLQLPHSMSVSFRLMLEESSQSTDEGRLEPLTSILKSEPTLLDTFTVVQEVIRLSLRQGCYDSRARVLVYIIGNKLGITEQNISSYEDDLGDSMTVIFENNKKNHEEANKRKLRRKAKKAFLIGLGVVTGGAIIGLTGGLAAPVVAASAGALIGGTGATFLASSAGLALITSVFGATGAGLTGYKMNRRVGMTDEFEFVTLSTVRRLHLTICVSGWLVEDDTDEFTTHWGALSSSLESYSLKWESKYLLELGSAIRNLVTSNLLGTAATEALKYTVLQGIMVAIAWPVALLNAGYVIDNPWSVCTSRAKEVGRELARVLLSRQHGRRPVTLIGFSLGARVIYHCLDELVEHNDSSGIVQDAVLLGAPVNCNEKCWKKISGVIAGKLVNGFCRKDWFLRFVYRASALRYNVAGLTEIPWNHQKMVNVDLTDIINGHMDYANPTNLRAIFEIIGIKTDSSDGSDREVYQWVGEILEEQLENAVAIAISKEMESC